MTTSLFHLLTYRDAPAALAFLEAIGFRRRLVVWEDDEQTTLSHAQLSWGRHGGVMLSSLHRDGLESHPEALGTGRCYLVVDTDADVDATFARALAAGATARTEPEDQDYGGRNCGFADAEGNSFAVGSYPGVGATDALRPKLVVAGADTAIDFYRRAFGARVRARYEMDGLVVFSQLELPGGFEIQLKDADDADPAASAAPGVVLELTVDDPDPVWDRAVAAGAEVRFPLADQPYGARQGRLIDPFAHQWLIGAPSTMDPGEIQAALDQL